MLCCPRFRREAAAAAVTATYSRPGAVRWWSPRVNVGHPDHKTRTMTGARASPTRASIADSDGSRTGLSLLLHHDALDRFSSAVINEEATVTSLSQGGLVSWSATFALDQAG
jgi:hypothetical protein